MYFGPCSTKNKETPQQKKRRRYGMLPLVLLYGCFYGLNYVELLWSELCVCLCLLL
jgi:hypothetical protein